jgi:tRNA(Ile)-lysidine synthase TilS/MesJ
MIVTVIGLERYAVMRAPNGAECDCCGARVNFSRYEARQELDQLENQGWKFRHRGIGADAFCPKCAGNKI